jgi:hypothetical protein
LHRAAKGCDGPFQIRRIENRPLWLVPRVGQEWANHNWDKSYCSSPEVAHMKRRTSVVSESGLTQEKTIVCHFLLICMAKIKEMHRCVRLHF